MITPRRAAAFTAAVPRLIGDRLQGPGCHRRASGTFRPLALSRGQARRTNDDHARGPVNIECGIRQILGSGTTHPPSPQLRRMRDTSRRTSRPIEDGCHRGVAGRGLPLSRNPGSTESFCRRLGSGVCVSARAPLSRARARLLWGAVGLRGGIRRRGRRRRRRVGARHVGEDGVEQLVGGEIVVNAQRVE